MSENHSFRVEFHQKKDFSFNVDFGLKEVDKFLMDEPEPLGEEAGPNASRVLAAAVGNCLCASLLFCLRKSRVETSDIKASVNGAWVRNELGRWRIKEMQVEIMPSIPEEHSKRLERCIEIFEQFCVVSQSIKDGVKINVKIHK